MITLATLKEASLQQIFDQVVTHLLTQNKKAIESNGACRYRTDSGLKCAVGCLINDDEYDPKMDGGSNLDSVTGLTYRSRKYKLLLDLQNIHDLNKPENWPLELKQLAEEFNLEYNHDSNA